MVWAFIFIGLVITGAIITAGVLGSKKELERGSIPAQSASEGDEDFDAGQLEHLATARQASPRYEENRFLTSSGEPRHQGLTDEEWERLLDHVVGPQQATDEEFAAYIEGYRDAPE